MHFGIERSALLRRYEEELNHIRTVFCRNDTPIFREKDTVTAERGAMVRRSLPNRSSKRTRRRCECRPSAFCWLVRDCVVIHAATDAPPCDFYGCRGIGERDRFREQSFTRKFASARYYTQFYVTAEDATCHPSQSSTLNVSRDYSPLQKKKKVLAP